jgi:hypothetical protein
MDVALKVKHRQADRPSRQQMPASHAARTMTARWNIVDAGELIVG